jgi:PKD repeat protein
MALVRDLLNIKVVFLFLVTLGLITGIVVADGCGLGCAFSDSGSCGGCSGLCGYGNLSLCPFGGSCGYIISPAYMNVMRPDIAASPVSGTVPLKVQFKDNSGGAGGVTSWSWDFGDGSFGIGMSPVHTYEVPGTYTVTLTVRQGKNSGLLEWGASSTTQRVQLITASPGVTTQVTGTGASSSQTSGIQNQSGNQGIYTPSPGFSVPDLSKFTATVSKEKLPNTAIIHSPSRGGIYGY